MHDNLYNYLFMKDDIDATKQKIIQAWLGTGSINIFGPQFAGKDTQGRMLAEAFNGSLIGGGDIIRNRVVPKELKDTVATGKLVPSEDYVKTVLPYLTRPEFRDGPLILSAVGRWHGEEESVIKVASKSHHPLKAVIYLRLENDIVWQRWQRHREIGDREIRRDDSREGLEMRLEEFHEKTLPVIDFYRDMGVLIEIDGSLPPEQAFHEIIRQLFERSQAQG